MVDPVGDRWAEPALRAIRWGGRFVTVGYAGGDIPRIPLNIVLLKNITVRGLELRTWTERLPEETAHAREALTDWSRGGMRPAVSEVHELEDVGTALRRVADRLPTGKVVIRVAILTHGATPRQDGHQQEETMAEPVLVERRGHVQVITINRPEARNALDGAAARALAAAADELDADDALRVGVLTGAGGTFCAGMDLKAWMRGDKPNIEGRGFGGITITPPRKPLIAAVEGYALAGGFELMLACDLVVAGERQQVRRARGQARPGGRRRRRPAAAPAHPVRGGDGAAADRRADHRRPGRRSSGWSTGSSRTVPRSTAHSRWPR